MTTTLLAKLGDGTPSLVPQAVFGCSAEGFPIARVGDTAFAMLTARDGRHYLATAWRLAKPLADWTRADFHGHSGELANEAAFRSHIEENALHQRQRAALGRREVFARAHTPWGTSQGATVYAEGVICHTTAGHGGFHLSPERNAQIHPALRAADGFYEEDCCWAAVAQAFPTLFTDFENIHADLTIRNWFPQAWAEIHGVPLEPGDLTAQRVP